MLASQIILASLVFSLGHPAPKSTVSSVTFLRANIDASVNPGVDFFSYANGGWIKRHPIPASESSWGIGNLVQDELYAKLRSINVSAATRKSAKGSDDQKVGDFWKTAMDQKKANALGLKPLKFYLDQINSITSPGEALGVGTELQEAGVDCFWGLFVGQDEKHSDQMSVHLWQSGLGLPERDFYLKDSADFKRIRNAYVTTIDTLLALAGSPTPGAGQDVLSFETEIAKISRKLEDLRDPIKNYNPTPVNDLDSNVFHSFGIRAYLDQLHLNTPTVIVGQPEFVKGLNDLVDQTDVAVLKAYLTSHLIEAFAPYLDAKTDKANFAFFSTVLSGQKVQKPRWKRALSAEGSAIGFITGRLFVRDYFPPKAKKRYVDMVNALRRAYGERIDRLDWMSPSTKAAAHKKLATLVMKVGYPDKWKDYSKLSIGTDSYCENMIAARKWAFADMVSKFGKPVDRTEWGMTPQTYNAYYNPSNNEIVLPAAQFAIPTLLDAQIDDAVAYGYSGASTIGHEMTHGFDDDGRQYDEKGNLKDWWTASDAKKFNKRALAMVKEFNAYEPLPGIHINGKASLGENIADYGGLLLGIDAFKKTAAYKSGKKVGGFTPMQRFFLGYTLGWLSEDRKEALRRQLLSDVHAPAKWRVIGPLSNIPEFYKAFGIKPGQPMWRPENQRVHIW